MTDAEVSGLRAGDVVVLAPSDRERPRLVVVTRPPVVVASPPVNWAAPTATQVRTLDGGELLMVCVRRLHRPTAQELLEGAFE